MSWVWLDLSPDPVAGAMASAPAFDPDGRAVGVLGAWRPDDGRPSATAAKIDRRAVDPYGGTGWVSLVRAPGRLFLPFDDPAVVSATRMVLAMSPADVFSTLVEGDDRCVGALTGVHDATGRLQYDPFANLFPAVVLRVGEGILGRMPAPTGPGTQRYGADNPWPWDRF